MSEIPAGHWLNSLRTPPEPDPDECPECYGGGWTCYGLGYGDPHFKECESCHNPEGHPAP